MKKIPEWQYPLYKEPDKIAYAILENAGRSKRFPKFIGSRNDINDFFKLLILSQKNKDYRKFRDSVLDGFKEDIRVRELLQRNMDIKVPKGVDKSWAILLQDRRLCELMDEFQAANMHFLGTNNEIAEFTIRFIHSQLLQDWRGPLMAVLLECLSKEKISLSKLNNLLKTWDYTKIFKN